MQAVAGSMGTPSAGSRGTPSASNRQQQAVRSTVAAYPHHVHTVPKQAVAGSQEYDSCSLKQAVAGSQENTCPPSSRQ